MMKINTLRFILILIVTSVVTACATDGNGGRQVSNKPLTEIERQMADIMATSKLREMIFIEVPSPNNLISEKLMLATMALGEGSTAVDALNEILKKGSPIHVGVVGKSQAINVITVKQSLKNMAGKPAKGTVYLIADAKAKEELVALNQNKNVNIVVVAQP